MDVAFAEGEVTRARREFKLLRTPSEANLLAQRLAREHSGLHTERTRIVSIYFDRAEESLAKRAQRHPDDCVKVRTKEYFPNRSSERDALVFEVKREHLGYAQKHRLWLPRRELEQSLRAGAAYDLLLASSLRSETGFGPLVAVSYVRRVYQAVHSWRVTLDVDVSFHLIEPKLAFGLEPVSYERLSPALARETRTIVEVKHQAELPDWLFDLQGEAERYSKFVEAVRHKDRTLGG